MQIQKNIKWSTTIGQDNNGIINHGDYNTINQHFHTSIVDKRIEAKLFFKSWYPFHFEINKYLAWNLNLVCNNKFVNINDFLKFFNSKEQIKCLLNGHLGNGKSELLKYIGYKWSQNQIVQNKDIIYLDLRHTRCIPIDSIEKTIKKVYEKNFKFNDNNIFIIDGLDQIDNHIKIEILQKLSLKNHYIISSIHGRSAYNSIVNTKCTIKGFKQTFEKVDSIIGTQGSKKFKEDQNKFAEYIKNVYYTHNTDIKTLYLACLFIWNNQELRNIAKNPLFFHIIMTKLISQKKQNIALIYMNLLEEIILYTSDTILEDEELHEKCVNMDQVMMKFVNIKDLESCTIRQLKAFEIKSTFLLESGIIEVNDNREYFFIDRYFEYYYLAKFLITLDLESFKQNLLAISNKYTKNIVNFIHNMILDNSFEISEREEKNAIIKSIIFQLIADLNEGETENNIEEMIDIIYYCKELFQDSAQQALLKNVAIKAQNIENKIIKVSIKNKTEDILNFFEKEK